MNQPYIEINDLRVNYNTFEGSKTVLHLDHLHINKGEAYGIIGESGAGKTILALSILNLVDCPPGEITEGEILLEGRNLLKINEKILQKEIRGKKIAMIFQDPMSTLNPVFTIGAQLENVIMENQKVTRKVAEKRAIEMIQTVKLADGERVMNKFPHELSGGQRQRVIIALALSCGAEMIIADEPTRNLDVTIQAGILKLIKEIQRDLKVTVLFIANNPGLASAICDRVAIIHSGEIIEEGITKEVLKSPKHPYTLMLLHAVPKGKDEQVNLDLFKIDDSLSEVEGGCCYFNRCRYRNAECQKTQLSLEVDHGHFVKCHKWEEIK